MLNALIITDNLKFTKEVIHAINMNNLNIRLLDIAETQAEMEQILSKFTINLIFFDKKISKSYKRESLHRYKDILIIPSYDSLSPCVNEQNVKDINTIIHNYDAENRRKLVTKELEYIGYNFKYNGTHYLLDTILEMYLQDSANKSDNLKHYIYPIIAKKYNKTIYNIKSSIGAATDSMYAECDVEKLTKYFHFCDDTKPTPKQVVFAVMNKIYRM